MASVTENLTTLVNGTSRNGSAFQGPEEPHQCALFRFLLYAVAMGFMCIFGFVGNTVSFMVLHKDRSTPVASFLLKSLAVADNIFLLLWAIHYMVKNILGYFEVPEESLNISWIYVRVFSFPVLFMAQTLTIWLTVVIALNRFMAVCLPYKAPHLCNIINVYKEVAVVTIFSIVYNIPRFFELQVVKNDEDLTPGWNRTSLGINQTYKRVYTDGLYYLFSFILPLLILAFVNTRVIIAYQATQKRKRRMSTRRTDNENNITLVMIMVVVIFMLCQAPARVVQCAWGYRYNHCFEFQYYLIHISNTLEVLNSSVNFLIYCIFHKRFRDILYASYCCGPIAEWARKDSQRFTTTEGLSLEEANVTRTASHKINCRNGASRSSDKDRSQNGSLNSGVTTVAINSPAPANAADNGQYADQIALSEDAPLKPTPSSSHDEQNSALGPNDIIDDVIDDDVTKPLTPCKSMP